MSEQEGCHGSGDRKQTTRPPAPLSNVPNCPRTTARRESESSKIELMDIVASLSAARMSGFSRGDSNLHPGSWVLHLISGRCNSLPGEPKLKLESRT
jgi:hypothetical protein